MRKIELPCFGITIELNVEARGVFGLPQKYGGTITSGLRLEEADAHTNPAVHALESLILAHACAGVDIESPAYIEGIETAVDAIGNNF